MIKFGLLTFLVTTILFSIVDILVGEYHYLQYGPYHSVEGKVVYFYGDCSKANRSMKSSHLDVEINGILESSDNLFIGVYPWRFCFINKFYSIIDYKLFEKLKRKGSIVKLIVDKNNKLYIGRVPLKYNLVILLTSMLMFFLIKKFYICKEISSKNTKELLDP